MKLDDIPLSGDQLTIVALVVGLVAAAAVGPALLAPDNTSSTANETETPRSGTYQTPEPVVNRSDPGQPENLNAVPLSHTESRNISAPERVSASTGAQTMDVAATTVDGQPALQLEDENTHSGRWVSVPATWFDDHYGGVPERAYIDHSSGEEYTTQTYEEGGDVTFYVEEFSTNTVTFSGEVVLSGNGAGDGTQYSYDIADLDAASNFTVSATGVDSTERDTVSSAGLSSGSTVDLQVAGSAAATNANVTFDGEESTTSTSSSGTGSATVSAGGNVNPENEEVDFSGEESTTSSSDSGTSLGDGDSLSLNIGGNADPTNEQATFTGTGVTRTDNFVNTQGDGTADTYEYYFIGDTNNNYRMRASATVELTEPSRVTDIGYYIDYNDLTYNPDVTIRIASGSSDNTYGEGTVVTTGHDPSGSGTGLVTVPLDSPQTLDAGTYEIEFITTNTDNAGDTTMAGLASDSSQSGYYDATNEGGDTFSGDAPNVELQTQGTVDPSVSVGGSTASYSGYLSDGQSATVNFDSGLSRSDSSATVSTYGTTDVTVSYDEVTATEDPSIDVDGDGTADASYSGILRSGESSGNIALDGLSTGDNSISTSTVAGPQPSWTLSYDEVTATENPGVDVDGDGTDDATYTGILRAGESSPEQSLPDLSTGASATVSTATGTTGITTGYTEHTYTEDLTVDVNADQTSYTGTLSPGTTTTLTSNTTWLQSGTNRVNISLSSTTAAEAPPPLVTFDYSHESADEISTDYSESRWLEEYNVSKTFSSDRSSATLTIPHQSEVISVQNVEVRTNGGTWASVPQSDYSLDNTELTVQLGTITAGDTVEVRTTGSLARVNNGAITVTDPTTSGDLDTRFTVDSWAADSYIAVPQTSAYNRVHYVHDGTWTTDDDVRVLSDGTQRLRLPSAAAGQSANVSTIPVAANPQTGDVVIEVNSTNETQPVIDVSGGQEFNDDVNYTFINASDGTTYSLYSLSNDIVRDSGTASSPLTLTDNDGTETLTFLVEESGSSSSSGTTEPGSGIISRTGGNGQFIPLIGIAIAIGGLLVISQRDEPIGDGVGSGVERAVGGIPRIGDSLAGPLGSVSASAANLVETIFGNRTIALAIATALGLGAIQAGFISLPSGSLVIVTVAVVAVLSFVGLRQIGEFKLEYWAGILVAATVVALQVLSDESLLTAIVNSQVWPVLALGALVLAYRGIQGIRQPDTVQTFEVETQNNDNDDNGGNQ